MTRPFQLVDVFGRNNFTGNPLAVVADADDLSTETMQRIARWLNLSETTFLCRPSTPEADYRVRIFTLDRELPFAGHPTLGSCHAWLTDGGLPQREHQIVQECGVGLVTIGSGSERLAFAAPPLIRSGPVEEDILTEVAAVLRIGSDAIVDAAWIDNGPGWLGVILVSADAVLALEPTRAHHRRIEIGVVGPHPAGAEAEFEVRALFSDQHGAIIEDPVTGSLNASLAQWLFESGRAARAYVAAQGTKLGRSGRVFIDCDADRQIWVGGATRTLFSGTADL